MFQTCYNTSDKSNVATIKDLYVKLGLRELYKEQEETSRQEIQLSIDTLSLSPLRSLFETYLNNLYGRSN